MLKAILSPRTLAARSALAARAAQLGGLLVRKDSVVPCPRAWVRRGGLVLTFGRHGHHFSAAETIVGGSAGDASGGDGVMAGPSRDEVRGSWGCAANGGR